MSEQSQPAQAAGRWISRWLTAVLAAAAVVALATGLWRALAPDDTEAMESPLLLAAARQLVASPWELYGPYGANNPLVLIHAPLYYRLAALLAWPVHAAGCRAVTAALVAGRLLSLLGLVITLATVYRLARVDGARAEQDGGPCVWWRHLRSLEAWPFRSAPTCWASRW